MSKKNLSAEELLSAAEKKHEKLKKFFKIFIITVIAAAAVALVVFVVGRAISQPDSENKKRPAFEQLSSQGKGQGYPYLLRSNDVYDSGIAEKNLVFAASGRVTILDKNAKEISKLQYSCKNPTMEISNGHILLYDREGTYARMQDLNQVLWEKEMELPILSVELGKNGNMAFLFRSKKALNELKIYNKNFKELFTYQPSSDYIIDMALSDNGKYAAIISANAENGQMVSKLTFFEVGQEKEIGSYTYNGANFFDVTFTDGKTVAVTGDKKRIVFTDFKEDENAVEYGSSVLKYFAESENGIQAVALSEYNSNKNIIKVFKGSKEVFSYECEGSVKALDTDGSRVTVLIDNRLVTLNLIGRETGSITVESDSIKCFTVGGTTYVMSLGSVEKYNNRASDK